MPDLVAEPLTQEQNVGARTTVEHIAKFAIAVRPEHLTPHVRQLYKRNILDSLGCAIAAMITTLGTLALLFMTACAGSTATSQAQSGTPKGTYNITVTGTSATLQHSVALTLNVQ